MGLTFEKDKDLRGLTTFGIEAKAKLYLDYKSQRELEWIMRQPEYTDNEVLHIGGGSNLLFVNDFEGLVLHSAIKGITTYDRGPERVFVIAGAGEKWTDLVDFCVDNDLAGLENLAGIPGEVGAAPVQNVGAYGAEAKDVIFAVEVMDTKTGKTERLTNEDCRFGYRQSMFKEPENKGRYFVLRVSFLLKRTTEAFNLSYGPLKELAERLGHTPTIREVRDEVLAIRGAKLPDPAEIGSAGSFFKNPIIRKYLFRQEVLPRYPELKMFPVGEHTIKLSAAQLIDVAGLKGAKVGGAEVYDKQPLVIVNRGDATAKDVVELSRIVQERVLARFGVWLEPEVNFIDSEIKVTVLGSGTSKGVPEPRCLCEVCTSEDPRDKRTRASVLVQAKGVNILVDPGPDFREQAIREGIFDIDAVLITHSHYDHVGGIDDLRPYCAGKNLPIYCRPDVSDDLHRRIDYCFREALYPGVPTFSVNTIEGDEPFLIKGVKIVPVNVMHGKLPIIGFRIGDFAYITDAKTIEPEELVKLDGVKVLIINALRMYPHFAHLDVEEALEIIKKVNPEKSYLTHICHSMGKHADVEKMLPENVHLAYDGLTFNVK